MGHLDKRARIVLAIQRAGHDHLGDSISIHENFLEILQEGKDLREALISLMSFGPIANGHCHYCGADDCEQHDYDCACDFKRCRDLLAQGGEERSGKHDEVHGDGSTDIPITKWHHHSRHDCAWVKATKLIENSGCGTRYEYCKNCRNDLPVGHTCRKKTTFAL